MAGFGVPSTDTPKIHQPVTYTRRQHVCTSRGGPPEFLDPPRRDVLCAEPGAPSDLAVIGEEVDVGAGLRSVAAVGADVGGALRGLQRRFGAVTEAPILLQFR